MCRKMPDVLLVFSAIALTLSSVTPAPGLPRNIHGIKSFENIWDSEWVAPRSSRQQTVMPSTDYAHFLAKGSPYSTSMAWPEPDAQVQCGAKNMTLHISRLGTSPLHVNTSDSWVTLFQKLPQCSRATSRHRRSVWPHYHACDFSQQAGPATFPVRVAGTPLVVGCPYPPRGPVVECSDDLQLRLGGVSVSSLKMKVMGHWYPLMTICNWCRLSVELQGGQVSIKSPLKGPCTEMLGGQHAISIRSGDAEMVFSCSPSPPLHTYPYGHSHIPPYGLPHTPPYGFSHFPWPNVHVPPPAPIPWPVPPPKPVNFWPTIPYHGYPSPAPTWPPITLWPPAPAPTWPPITVWPPAPAPTWPPIPTWPPAPAPTWPPIPTWPPAPAPVLPVWPPAPAPSWIPWPPVPAPAPALPTGWPDHSHHAPLIFVERPHGDDGQAKEN